ncbi:MAG: SDR family NAD(P)-dependent oxidoreductase [Pseudomonadota bacterium]
MADRSAFGADTTADEVLEGIDLTGKRVLITGGTSGLGRESARAMAAHGADVTITGRSQEKAAAIAAELKAETGREVAAEALELGSFKSIRSFADRIRATGAEFDIVINNAGVMACPEDKTEDGFEMQFGSNHLGHFLMTALIAPQIRSGGRVVALSSSGHQMSPVLFDDIQFETSPYEKWTSYGQSKTANALFAVGLNARLKDRGIEAFAVHPGAIMTELARHMDEADIERFTAMIDSGALPMKAIPQGAATQVYAATAPELTGHGGAYLADVKIAPVDEEAEDMTVVRPYAIDPAAADRLWAVSEEMVGETLAR